METAGVSKILSYGCQEEGGGSSHHLSSLWGAGVGESGFPTFFALQNVCH